MYLVSLAYAPNPDIDGGYWNGQPHEGHKAECIGSLESASAVCLAYIARNGLGAGNWTGGHVVDVESGELVATISYNGRIWPVAKRPEHTQREY
jgi:hypothetical protein